MTFERWGSLSVDDHVNPRALVANILLYDRLILPVMTAQADRDERAYWVSKGWDPDLQRARVDQLQDLAIQRPWDAARRANFRTRVEQLAAERRDADPYHATRMILAQEQIGDKPEGVDRITVVAAYNSTKSLTTDFHVANTSESLGAQAYLLSRRLAIPNLPAAEDALKVAIALSRGSRVPREAQRAVRLAGARCRTEVDAEGDRRADFGPDGQIQRRGERRLGQSALAICLSSFQGSQSVLRLVGRSAPPPLPRCRCWNSQSWIAVRRSKQATPSRPRCSTISRTAWGYRCIRSRGRATNGIITARTIRSSTPAQLAIKRNAR